MAFTLLDLGVDTNLLHMRVCKRLTQGMRMVQIHMAAAYLAGQVGVVHDYILALFQRVRHQDVLYLPSLTEGVAGGSGIPVEYFFLTDTAPLLDDIQGYVDVTWEDLSSQRGFAASCDTHHENYFH